MEMDSPQIVHPTCGDKKLEQRLRPDGTRQGPARARKAPSLGRRPSAPPGRPRPGWESEAHSAGCSPDRPRTQRLCRCGDQAKPEGDIPPEGVTVDAADVTLAHLCWRCHLCISLRG